MYKERTIQKPDYGIVDTPYYMPYSTGIWTSDPDAYFTRQRMAEDLASGIRTQGISGPSWIGKESFLSTEQVRPIWNSCSHHISNRAVQKLHNRYQITTGWTYYAGGLWGYGCSYYPCWMHGYLPGTVNLPLQIAVFDREFSARAWWTMQPRIKSEVSMINFLFELKDFSFLTSQFRSLARHRDFRKLTRSFRSIRRNDVGLTRPLSEVLLTWNFALVPLMKDLAAIITQMNVETQKVVDKFVSDGTNPTTSHYSEQIRYTNPDDPRFPLTSATRGGSYVNVTKTASIERSYSYRPESAYAEFMKLWGLNLTPEALWNGLPLSFLVDYVATINKSIKMMSIQKGVDFRYSQYAESLLSVSEDGIFAHHPDGWICLDQEKIHTNNPVLITGRTSSSFERRVGDPYKGPALPQFRAMSSKQALNTLALLRCMF